MPRKKGEKKPLQNKEKYKEGNYLRLMRLMAEVEYGKFCLITLVKAINKSIGKVKRRENMGGNVCSQNNGGLSFPPPLILFLHRFPLSFCVCCIFCTFLIFFTFESTFSSKLLSNCFLFFMVFLSFPLENVVFNFNLGVFIFIESIQLFISSLIL